MIFVVATLSVAAGQCCECCNKWFGKKVILSINGTLIWCNHRPTSAPTHGTRGLEESRYKYEKYGKPGANGSKAAIINASFAVPLPHVYEQRCDWEVFLSLVLTITINISLCNYHQYKPLQISSVVYISAVVTTVWREPLCGGGGEWCQLLLDVTLVLSPLGHDPHISVNN